jgi:hypothetical protein
VKQGRRGQDVLRPHAVFLKPRREQQTPLYHGAVDPTGAATVVTPGRKDEGRKIEFFNSLRTGTNAQLVPVLFTNTGIT